MKETFDYNKVPYRFCMCIASNCTKAKTCLRNIALEHVPLSERDINILNPKLIIGNYDSCQYYLDNQKIRYAKGFIGIMNSLPHKIHNLAITYLQGMFNGRNYYRVRKGERLLSPEEQERVLNLLNRIGAQGPLEFDAYIEDYNW